MLLSCKTLLHKCKTISRPATATNPSLPVPHSAPSPPVFSLLTPIAKPQKELLNTAMEEPCKSTSEQLEQSFFTSLIQTCLKSWVATELPEGSDIQSTECLPAGFCLKLQEEEPIVEGQSPGMAGQPGTAEGVLAHPLYRHVAVSLHRWISSGTFPIQLPPVEGLEEDDTWQEKVAAWTERVVPSGTKLLEVRRRVALEVGVMDIYYNLLKDGKKTVEGRLNAGDYALLKGGDLLLFNKTLLLQVKDVVSYPTFRAMMESEGLRHVLPGVDSVEQGVAVYRQFYSEEQEQEHGALAIRVCHPESGLQQPEVYMRAILQDLGIDGIRLLLRMRRTAGSVPESLPPPRAALLQSFSAPNDPTRTLSVGARALAKHSHRSISGWWGECAGPETRMNALALNVVRRILDQAVWLNVHCLPHDLPIFEIRGREGYGARWASDGSQFRGFLEPQMVDGHDKQWRH